MRNLYKKGGVIYILMCALLLTSCVKDELLNTECDVEEAYLSLKDKENVFFNLSDTIINVAYTDSIIKFNVKKGTDLRAMAPMFKLTNGATISPKSGTVRDFSKQGQMYTTTSEDGMWHRNYYVDFNIISKDVQDELEFNFENYQLDDTYKKYYVWYDKKNDGSLSYDWATGNPGFLISMGTAAANEYPTTPYLKGKDGACVLLTTRSTGPFGVMANKRIAAGNLFLGTFDVSQALGNTLKSTRFGIVFNQKPLKFKGYYKYKPGEKYQDKKGKIIENKTDEAAIYAVFYLNKDNDGNSVVLFGDDIKTSKQIVAIADLGYVAPSSEWKMFELDFQYFKDIDYKTIENLGCNIAIVFSSSKDGDLFEGAIGSELMIDNVKLICEKQ